jgi:hypothetical protein
MILTWLWKMFLEFRRGREPAVLEASRTPGDVLDETEPTTARLAR